jgi:hypothetical protein
MHRRYFNSRIGSLVAGLLLLSIALGDVALWLRADQQNLAASLVEEVELDSEESRSDDLFVPCCYEVPQVCLPEVSRALDRSESPRLGNDATFLRPQRQRPPPV